MADNSKIEVLCERAGMRMTGQRRVIARILSESDDHPDVEVLHRRAVLEDSGISIATVYRTVKLFEEAGILTRHDFGDGRSRYETISEDHHDHLIDLQSGKVIEFSNDFISLIPKYIFSSVLFKKPTSSKFFSVWDVALNLILSEILY